MRRAGEPMKTSNAAMSVAARVQSQAGSARGVSEWKLGIVCMGEV